MFFPNFLHNNGIGLNGFVIKPKVKFYKVRTILRFQSRIDKVFGLAIGIRVCGSLKLKDEQAEKLEIELSVGHKYFGEYGVDPLDNNLVVGVMEHCYGLADVINELDISELAFTLGKLLEVEVIFAFSGGKLQFLADIFYLENMT